MISEVINNSHSVILRGRLIRKRQSYKGLESNQQVMYETGKRYKPGHGQDYLVLNNPENYDNSILHYDSSRKSKHWAWNITKLIKLLLLAFGRVPGDDGISTEI